MAPLLTAVPTRLIGGLIVAGAIALSAIAWVKDLDEAATVSSPAAIEAAATWLRDQLAPEDQVVITPAWERGAWETLRGAGPGTEQFPFPALIIGERPDPMGLLRASHLWVIGAHHRAPELPAVIAGMGTRDRSHDQGDGVSVARYTLRRLLPIRSLTADLPELTVAHVGTAGVRVCKPGRSRHRCGLKPWFDPHLEVRDVGHLEVEWIYAHPEPNGGALRFTWKKLPTEGWLVLRAGFTQAATRHPEGSPTEIAVQVGDRVSRLTLQPQDYGLGRLAIPLSPSADGAPVDAQISLHAEDADWREVMLEADVVETLPDPVRAWLAETIGEVSASE